MAPPLAASLLAAARAIAAVIGGRNLDGVLAELKLPAELRPAVMDFSYGALRAYGRGDFFLGRLLREPLKDTVLRALLLAAIYRLEARPEEAHTTVNQAVTAVGELARGRYKSLANGLLRNFLRRQPELAAAAAADEEASFQHPAWWLEKLRQAYPDRWRDVAAAGNSHPPMTLRVNRRRMGARDYEAELAAAGIEARALDDGVLLLARPVGVDRLPGFAAGWVSVQDWGAQRAADLLELRPGLRVLDACAAPGGKTAHILEAAEVEVTALEADPVRARRIDENLSRLGLAATVKVADCRDISAWWDGRPFDRILADVPCSATGVVRRHPDAKWLRRPGDGAGFARQQAEILPALWQVLAPGGTMLYATCSVFPEENGAQVAAFAAGHDDVLRRPTGNEPGNDKTDEEWQLLPDAEHDGFYYALLEKRR